MPGVTCVGCSLKEGFIVGGILLGYLASALWVGDTGGWRYMYGAALPPAFIVFAGMVSPSSTPSSSSAPLLPLTFLLPLLHLFFLFLQCHHCLQLVSVADPLIAMRISLKLFGGCLPY